MEYKTENCPGCDFQTSSVAYENSFFELPVLNCKNCSLFFTSQKEKNKIKEYYNDSYWSVFRNIKNKKIVDQKYDDAYVINKIPNFLRKIVEKTGIRKSLALSQFIYLKLHIKGNNLFEIGSGEGFLLEKFEKNGFNVSGIEPSKINIQIINNKLKEGKCENKFVEDISFSKKFDIIIMSHVLEHLINNKEILCNMKNGLVDNGILFIEVPNCQHTKTLDHSVQTQPHMFHFSKHSLQKLLENSGFEVLCADTFTAEVFSFWQHVSYFLHWVFKIDFYKKTPENVGNRLRVIATSKNN